MKRILLAAAGLVLLLLPATSMAGVVGSDHDLQVSDTAGGTATVCYSCHVPHNAYGDKLWATGVSASDSTDFGDIGALCYSCHDGSLTTIGQATVFNTSLEQHKPLGIGCSDATAGCHDVHNQNANLTGKFLVIDQVDGSYCVDCHDDAPYYTSPAPPGGDHRTTVGGNHQSNNDGFKCQQCHTPHGATKQGTNPGTLTNPILLADNQTGTYYGDFCVSCHAGTAPSEAVSGSGGQAASDTNTYTQTTVDGSETSHPTQGGVATITGCNFCHDVHGAGSADSTTLLKSANANSAYCKSCHESGGDVPGVGGNSHPIQVEASDNTMNGGTYTLPWAQSINDDGLNGADYAGTTDHIVCETCHSVHRKGFTGTDNENFLRAPNGTGNTICKQCHVQGQ